MTGSLQTSQHGLEVTNKHLNHAELIRVLREFFVARRIWSRPDCSWGRLGHFSDNCARKLDGAVERGLDRGGICRRERGPGYEDAREGLRDKKTVPGAELPGALRQDVEGADVLFADKLGKLGDAGFGNHRGTRGPSAVTAQQRPSWKARSRLRRPTAAPRELEPRMALKPSRSTVRGDEFAVEAGADEDGDVPVAEAPGAGEQRTVPESVDAGLRGRADERALVEDVFVAERHAEAADEQARDAWGYGEGQALLEGVGHVVILEGAGMMLVITNPAFEAIRAEMQVSPLRGTRKPSCSGRDDSSIPVGEALSTNMSRLPSVLSPKRATYLEERPFVPTATKSRSFPTLRMTIFVRRILETGP